MCLFLICLKNELKSQNHLVKMFLHLIQMVNNVGFILLDELSMSRSKITEQRILSESIIRIYLRIFIRVYHSSV